MSDFIDNLLTRIIDTSAFLLPRPLSRFEPMSPSESPPAAETSERETPPPDISYETARQKTEFQAVEAPSTLLTETDVSPTAPVLSETSVSHLSPAGQVTKSPSSSEAATLLSATPESERMEKQESAGPAHLTPVQDGDSPASEHLPVETPSRSGVSYSDQVTAPSPPPKTILSPSPVEVDEAEPVKPKASPETSDEIPREAPRQPRHNILRAMVRQMVLQPISREEPARPSVEPAETAANMEAPAPEGRIIAGERHESVAAESLPRNSNLHSALHQAPTTPLRAKRVQNPESGVLAPTSGSLEKPLKAPAVSPTLKPLSQRIPPFPEAPQTTEVHITIGRVEVRATSDKAAASPPPKRQSEPEVMSLDAYLAQRTGEKG